ncbi:MAG: hypothetical protein H0U76_19430 [Ktedonobacteraceae bacterium]|nr:hypothetical protein [Ktedonobacteraceae bacterium]
MPRRNSHGSPPLIAAPLAALGLGARGTRHRVGDDERRRERPRRIGADWFGPVDHAGNA